MEEVLRKAIVAVAAKGVKPQILQGIVTEIDEAQKTCTIERNEAPTLYDVRLNAIIDNYENYIMVLPKQGSTVQCALIENDNTEAFIVSYSEIDRIEISANEIKLNGGELGGLVKVKELQAELNKTNELVRAIKDTLVKWVPVASDGGAALKTLVTGNLSLKNVGNFDDIEDPKILH